MRTLCNALMFNVSWLLIVSLHSGVLSLLTVAVHLLLHRLLMQPERSEWGFIALVTGLGLFLDQVLFALGLLSLPGAVAVAPLWLSALWPVLATTARHAFSALRRWPLLAAIAGGLGGFASYRLGALLSPVELGPLPYSDVLIGLLWALLLPLLLISAAPTATVTSEAGRA